MKKILTVIIFTSLFYSQSFEYGEAIGIPSGVKIEMSGEVEMEFIDVEGKGGAANREALRQEVYTRSPHTRIDKAVLDFKVYYSKIISIRYITSRILMIPSPFISAKSLDS